jgi:hypothetical protein
MAVLVGSKAVVTCKFLILGSELHGGAATQWLPACALHLQLLPAHVHLEVLDCSACSMQEMTLLMHHVHLCFKLPGQVHP